MYPPAEDRIFSVDALTSEIRKLLEMSYADIWVEGEVSSLSSPPSGHIYFTLKDQNSVLKCVLFKNQRFRVSALPVEGERFLLRGRISVYTARGDVQLICSYIEAAGEGELRRRFEAMKRKLAAEGLFDEDHKRPLPERPGTIALITSSHGAVLHDILSTLRRRYPLVLLKLIPVTVQGEGAVKEICAALRVAETTPAELIILARGGGSLEDLQAFNDETLARAIYDTRLPVVSAIGHETDFVIADFVADLRAPTPTAAATLVTPDRNEIQQKLSETRRQLGRLAEAALNQRQQRLDMCAQRLRHPRDRLAMQTGTVTALQLRLNLLVGKRLQRDQDKMHLLRHRLGAKSPEKSLNDARIRLNDLGTRLTRAVTGHLASRQAGLDRAQSTLQAYNPRKTLARGYSILQNQGGEVITRAEQVTANESLTAHLHRGRLDLTVRRGRDKADSN